MTAFIERLHASGLAAEESGFHDAAALLREAAMLITKLETKLDSADRLVMRLEGKIESLEDALGAHRASIKERS